MNSQILLNGLVNGLTIALLALAFNVVYQSTGVFHIAAAGIYALSPYLAWACIGAGCPDWLAFLVPLATAVLLSALLEVANHGPLERKSAPMGVHLVSSLGMYIMIVHFTALIWGSETKLLRHGLDSTLNVAGMTITGAQLIAACASLVTLILFFGWLRSARLGLFLRALSDNPTEMALRGYNIRRLRVFAFAVSGFLAAESAVLVAYDVGFDPHGGIHALTLAIVAVIIGGRQTFIGPLLGSLLLGLVRAQVVWNLSARWQDAVTFILLAGFLLLRPEGLLNPQGRVEANQ